MDALQDPDTAARHRFQSFKMGGGAPPQSLHTLSRHSHRRSHSRNNSVSSSVRLSSPAPPPPDANVPPNKRPTSHHHRRSSVSTRHESAELMGVSLPDLPTAPHSDDGFSFGDKDSIRRRALWALEGKPDLAFSKVEIPDIASPDVSKSFEFPTKPSFPPGSGLNGAKRDSFGKMFGSVSISKDQLGTLLEEEEEEEESKKEGTQIPANVVDGRENTPQVVVDPPAKILPRHRPASLILRPLSLVQGNVVNSSPGNLPTPTSTPSVYANTRKPSIAASLDDVVLPNFNVLSKDTSPFASQTPSARRSSYSFSDGMSVPRDLDKRRSSISYKHSSTRRDTFPLPTPEMTPTEHRFSFTGGQESTIEQPLSVADQHFLFRSHHVLLSRITELERTLRNRASRSRHLSYASDVSAASSEPSDEMLQLITDLKAERDELKRDVDGWRQRVADADKHVSLLAKQIEAERREAWLARSRLGLLEAEKSGLEKSVEAKASALSQIMSENVVLTRERDEMKDEIMRLNARLKDVDAAVEECTRLRSALEQERTRRKELEKLLDDAGLLNTPKLPHTVSGSWRRSSFPSRIVDTHPRGLGFQSIDSESSTTDVESTDDSFTKTEITLDAVAEEAEGSDEEDGLAGYEDEEDSDLSFASPVGSSVGLADELDIRSSIPAVKTTNHRVNSALSSQPGHESRPSLSKTWTFPKGKAAAHVKQDEEVDRFFGCLDDVDHSPPLLEEVSQSKFSSVFGSVLDDDELPPFVLPSDVGVVTESMSFGSLDITPEEERGGADTDDELVGEEVEGGIRFTFNAPPLICVTPPPDVCITPPPEIRITPPQGICVMTPAVRSGTDDSMSSGSVPTPDLVEDDEDESSLTFVFPPKVNPGRVGRIASPPHSSPSRTSSWTDSPPSSIPRAISLRTMSPKTPSITFTPSRSAPNRVALPSATIEKKAQSFIPQPAALPKSYPTSTRAQTSIKQSQSSAPNGSTFKPHSTLFTTDDRISALRCPNFAQSGGATSEINGSNEWNPSSPSACEYFDAQDTSSLSSIMSSPLAARSPFQKISKFFSLSWAPGATAATSYIAPSSSGCRPVETADNVTSSSSVDEGATRRAQRGFVPKARQLEKLRSRINLEKKNGILPCSMVPACKGCSAGDVYL